MASEDTRNSLNTSNEHYLKDEISLKEIVLHFIHWYKYILKQWPTILILAIIGGAIGFIHTNNKKLKYVATSTFVLQDEDGGVGQGNGLASILGFETPQSGRIFQGDNLLELYRTRFMIKKTLLSKVPGTDNDHVIDNYIKINGFKVAWKDSAHLRDINFLANYKDKKQARIQDSLFDIFTDDIRNNYLLVNKDRRLNILVVEVQSINEEFSKMLNEQMVKTVNEYYVQTKTKKSLDNLKLLQRQIDSIRAALNGAMYKVAVSSNVTVNTNVVRQQLRLPSQRSQVDVETNRAMLGELVRNLELSKMTLRKETPLIQILDEATFPLKRRRDSRAKAILIGAVVAVFIAGAYYTFSLILKKIMA